MFSRSWLNVLNVSGFVSWNMKKVLNKDKQKKSRTKIFPTGAALEVFSSKNQQYYSNKIT